MSWLIFGIMVVAILVGSVFRGSSQRQRNGGRGLGDSEPRRPRRPLPPPVQRKRLVPPPLPRQRVLEAVEVVPVVQRAQVSGAPPQALTPLDPLPSVSFKTATVEITRQSSPAALQLMAMLKNRKSLRAAVLLREVLAEPLCKRRNRP